MVCTSKIKTHGMSVTHPRFVQWCSYLHFVRATVCCLSAVHDDRWVVVIPLDKNLHIVLYILQLAKCLFGLAYGAFIYALQVNYKKKTIAFWSLFKVSNGVHHHPRPSRPRYTGYYFEIPFYQTKYIDIIIIIYSKYTGILNRHSAVSVCRRVVLL